MLSKKTGRREGLVLVITAISVVALIGAGASSHSDPDLAGRASLARLSGEVAGGVATEWQRLRRDPDLIGLSIKGEKLTWSLEPSPEQADALQLIPQEGHVVAEALLIEAQRLERELQDPRAALDLILDLFAKQPDVARRATARLRAIQLAVQVGKSEIALAQWQLASQELNGSEHLDSTSMRLLCTLAAAPVLSLEQRAAERDHLVELWLSGALALPAPELESNLLREVYRERLQGLLPEAGPDPRLERSALMERARSIELLVGEPLAAPQDEGVYRLTIGELELIYRRKDERTVEGCLVPVGTLAGVIENSVRKEGQLPDGFSLDFAGMKTDAGQVVRERVALAAGAPSFVLRHSDPTAIITAVSDRQSLVRTALFLLALGVSAAGFSVFRALRRERYLDELKSTFVANVSHELRTPVSSILLMAENLESERVTDPATRQRYHGLIRREADRLRRLVDDVLDFSRIERGKGVHLNLSEVQVESFGRELETEARERVTSAGGELTFAMNGVPRHIVADDDALRRATLNLVDNALRHSGVKDVEVKLDGDPESRGGLRIQVCDRGRGVPAGKLKALFLPFERLEAPAGDASGSAGTGLGLAIVREIAEGHQGTVTAHRPEGPDAKGLVFEIRIPAQQTMEAT